MAGSGELQLPYQHYPMGNHSPSFRCGEMMCGMSERRRPVFFPPKEPLYMSTLRQSWMADVLPFLRNYAAAIPSLLGISRPRSAHFPMPQAIPGGFSCHVQGSRIPGDRQAVAFVACVILHMGTDKVNVSTSFLRLQKNEPRWH